MSSAGRFGVVSTGCAAGIDVVGEGLVELESPPGVDGSGVAGAFDGAGDIAGLVSASGGTPDLGRREPNLLPELERCRVSSPGEVGSARVDTCQPAGNRQPGK